MNMKNNQTNLTAYATATRLELEVADTQGKLKFTKLPPAKARKAHLHADRVGGGSSRWHPAATAPRDGSGRRRAGAAQVR